MMSPLTPGERMAATRREIERHLVGACLDGIGVAIITAEAMITDLESGAIAEMTAPAALRLLVGALKQAVQEKLQ